MAPPSHKKPELWPYLTTVPQCVDPRGCKEPPLRNDRIWGSYEDSKTKSLEVGTVYWYECRYGVFDFNNGTKDIPSTLLPYMELTCVNDDRQVTKSYHTVTKNGLFWEIENVLQSV